MRQFFILDCFSFCPNLDTVELSMTIIAGHPFLTDFQTAKLLKTLNQCSDFHFTKLQSQQVYVFSKDLGEQDYQKAIQLLNHGDHLELSTVKEGELQVVVSPRFGTISPWATKATDIFNNCDVAIERVERVVVYTLKADAALPTKLPHDLELSLYDCMTQSLCYDLAKTQHLFDDHEPTRLNHIDVIGQGRKALEQANSEFGFALSAQDMDYLVNAYVNELKRNPTDVELMMFAQANSEHCRHKIFNADFILDGQVQPKSLFGMIRDTHKAHPEGTVVAYKDNSSVIEGAKIERFYPNAAENQAYRFHEEDTHIIMKVETHNHPTAIAPFAGAATGAGGEIRDEGATGKGSRPKAGLTGFSVSNLNIPGAEQPWEQYSATEAAYGKPGHISSALDIMLEGPIGGAAFNNEFGRPQPFGLFPHL